MFRTSLLAAAATAVLASQVLAAEITINVAGLDAKAAHAKILAGAHRVCEIETRDASAIEQPYALFDCVNDAVARAMVTMAANKEKASQTALAGR